MRLIAVSSAQRRIYSAYSKDTIQKLPPARATVATLSASEVVESNLDAIGVNLLWIVAPICITIVSVLLLALVVVAIRLESRDLVDARVFRTTMYVMMDQKLKSYEQTCTNLLYLCIVYARMTNQTRTKRHLQDSVDPKQYFLEGDCRGRKSCTTTQGHFTFLFGLISLPFCVSFHFIQFLSSFLTLPIYTRKASQVSVERDGLPEPRGKLN